MTYTRGPWRAIESGLYVFAGDVRICDVRVCGAGGVHLTDLQAAAIRQANGSLIAAAPDLFEAAQQTVTEWRRTGQLNAETGRALIAAIAKAGARA